MPINTITYAKVIQEKLDESAVRDMCTGWMDVNSGQVKYNGGNEVKIAKLSTQGLGDYDRDDGYPRGSISVTWETFQMTQDRGRKFQLDAMDTDETNFLATALNAMDNFQRNFVIPEIDAYRLSSIASRAITANTAGMVVTSQTITANTSTMAVLRAIKTGISKIREKGYSGELVIHATDAVVLEFEIEMAGRLQSITWKVGGVDTKVPALDGVPIIATPADRMVSAITLYDGKTAASGSDPDQTVGGFVKGASAKDINFMIMPRSTPIAVTKQDIMRIFDPATNQSGNAWAMDYRRYHDLWVLDNKVNSIYVNAGA